jgi:hypothetical protein
MMIHLIIHLMINIMIYIMIHIMIHIMINIMMHLMTYIMTNIMTNIMINVMTAWKKVHSHSGQLSKKMTQSSNRCISSNLRLPKFQPSHLSASWSWNLSSSLAGKSWYILTEDLQKGTGDLQIEATLTTASHVYTWKRFFDAPKIVDPERNIEKSSSIIYQMNQIYHYLVRSYVSSTLW